MNLLRDENLNWRHKFHELCTDYDLLNESHKKYIVVSQFPSPPKWVVPFQKLCQYK